MDQQSNDSSDEVPKDTGKGKNLADKDYVPGKPFAKIRRELSDEELNSSAVQKFLLGEIDRQEKRIQDLEQIEKKYHEVDKTKDILEEKIKTHGSLEVLYGLCLAAGSSLIGFSTNPDSKYSMHAFGLGVLLTIVGLIARYIKWK